MAFEPFAKNERPTMANFNKRFKALSDLWPLISEANALTSTALTTEDYIGIADTSEESGKRITLSDMLTFIANNIGSYGGIRIGTGTYSGSGSKTKTISVGFRPRFIIIMQGYFGTGSTSSGMYSMYKDFLFAVDTIPTSKYSDIITRTYTFSTSSFSVSVTYTGSYISDSDLKAIAMNNEYYTYYWFAIG